MSSKHHVSRRADGIWRTFARWYGADTIAKNFGPVPPQEWCDVIDQRIRTRDQLERILADVRSQHPNFPPRFPQFEQIVDRVTVLHDQANEGGPTVAERLVDYALKHKPLTPNQCRQPWRFIGQQFDAPGVDGKIRRNHGIEITALEIPPDREAGAPGHLVKVEDMQLAEAAV